MGSQTNNPQANRLISVAELSDHLGISLASVYRLLKSEPAFPKKLKIGSSAKFQTADVEAYLDHLSSKAQEAG